MVEESKHSGRPLQHLFSGSFRAQGTYHHISSLSLCGTVLTILGELRSSTGIVKCLEHRVRVELEHSSLTHRNLFFSRADGMGLTDYRMIPVKKDCQPTTLTGAGGRCSQLCGIPCYHTLIVTRFFLIRSINHTPTYQTLFWLAGRPAHRM